MLLLIVFVVVILGAFLWCWLISWEKSEDSYEVPSEVSKDVEEFYSTNTDQQEQYMDDFDAHYDEHQKE